MDEHITLPPPTDSAQPRVTDPKLELERQFTTFATLWSLATLLITWNRLELALTDSVSGVIHAGLSLAAIALIIRPKATIPLFLTAVLHAAHGLYEMPNLSTTDTAWMFFGAAIFGSFLTGWAVRRSYSVSTVGLYRSFAPCIRIMFVVAIFMMAFARANYGFLDLSTSPVVATLLRLRDGNLPPAWISYLTISMFLIVDAFLAVALMLPSLRRFAVGFGGCYFAWQALLDFGEARMMLPLILVGLYLFTSSEVIVRLHRIVNMRIQYPSVQEAGITVATILAVITIVGIRFKESDPNANLPFTSQQLVHWLTALGVTLWLLSLLSSLIDLRPKLTWVSMLVRNPIHIALLVLLISCAAAPYLGLGSRGRFVNDSGLHIAGGNNNHLLVPQRDLIGLQSDLVEIIESNDPFLQQLAAEGQLITWFDLINYVEPRPKTSMSFIRDGQRYDVEMTGQINELSVPNKWLHRKLLAYGLVNRKEFVSLAARKQIATNH